MFQCCCTDIISALVTCYILDQNPNPHLSVNTCNPTEFHSSNPNVICELWKSSIIIEITAARLLDASQTQISCLLELNYLGFSLGELSLLRYTKAPCACSSQVEIIICDWRVWLPGEKPERPCGWHAGLPTGLEMESVIKPSSLWTRKASLLSCHGRSLLSLLGFTVIFAAFHPGFRFAFPP